MSRIDKLIATALLLLQLPIVVVVVLVQCVVRLLLAAGIGLCEIWLTPSTIRTGQKPPRRPDAGSHGD